jgi:uncharacterized surface protein with fasciclin (FAS1) repeats
MDPGRDRDRGEHIAPVRKIVCIRSPGGNECLFVEAVWRRLTRVHLSSKGILMRCSSFRLALAAALVLPMAASAVADECPVAAAQKAKAMAQAKAQAHVQTVAFNADRKDIVDTAVGAGSFKTLVAAVQAAGLVETLKGAGPFTVFAPTDEAFAKLPAGTVESLLKPENKEKLVAVLTYHVVPGKVMAADVKAGKVKTVQGSELTVSTTGGVMVDKAKVTTTDIVANNGVIHVIDSVIMPK